jgi:FkbM family methyltransferase
MLGYLIWDQPRRAAALTALAAVEAGARLLLLGSKFAALVMTAGLLLGLLSKLKPARLTRWLAIAAFPAAAIVIIAIFATPFRVSGMTPGARLVLGLEAIASRSYGTDALIAENHYLDNHHSLLWGSSFAEITISWIPRQIWPSKPRSFTETVGNTVFAYSRQAGHVFFAPSYGGEWLLNFGMPGFVLGWLVFGIVAGYTDTRFRMPFRLLWAIGLAHSVEGGLVTQFWLALPFVAGGRLAISKRPVGGGPATHPSGAAPSPALLALRRLVRDGVVSRGYSWILVALPPFCWGGDSVSVATEAGPMVLPTTNRGAATLLLLGHAGEQRETALVRRLAESCAGMIDVGAHYGWYARVMALAAPHAKVVAIEPDPETYQYLVLNCRIPNIECINAAASDNDRSVLLSRAPASNLSSSTRPVGPPVQVIGRRLDDIGQGQLASTVDFVKCDVEGGEVVVLRGARRLLSAASPPIWMIEVIEPFLDEAGTNVEALLAEFRQSGRQWKLFTQSASGEPMEIETLSARTLGNNVFFVPSNRLEMFRLAADRLQAPV